MSDILPDAALQSPEQAAAAGPVDDIIPSHITDPVVVQAATKDPSLWDRYLGFQESQLAGATGGIGSLAGGLGYLGSLARGDSSEEAEKNRAGISSALTYAPRTEEGKQQTAAMSDAASLMGQKGGEIAGEKVADVTGSPALGVAANVAMNVPQYLVGAKAGEGLKAGAVEVPKPNPAVDVVKKAQDLGYVVPPATSNPTMFNKVAEGTVGKLSMAQAASIKNQHVTNSLVRQEFGLPEDAELSHDTMGQIRSQQSPAYEAVKAIPEIKFGPEYNKELSGLTGTADKITAELPGYKATGAERVQSLVDSIKPPSGAMSGETAVELSKSLRSEAASYESSSNRTGDPQDKALARAYRGSAAAVENAIQSHLEDIGKPELAENWDNARRTIAKTYSVQSALDGAGNVDAGKLGKQLIKGKPLSGNLEAAADFANTYPKAAKSGWSKESVPGMSPLDLYAGTATAIGSSMTGHDLVPSLLSGAVIPAARMGGRAALLSKAGQKLAVPGGVKQEVIAPAVSAAGKAALAGASDERQMRLSDLLWSH